VDVLFIGAWNCTWNRVVRRRQFP